jgi:EAL domain-containing protein (putative c-di-GMP-specific phosphodiesterase class I)
MDNNLPVVPVSINFSRLDFMVMDVPEVIESIINEYNIPKDFIHVEVTESALLEEGSLLKDAMKRLKDKGFALWLDDFGSGYSSFNALKDYDFDVLKLDMQFLVGFGENQKSRALIQSVISMANKVGMKTLSEGVETKEQAEFLKSISCGRLQGYLFGKPYSYDELKERIKKGEFVISKKVN